jgi:hypothetical protein
MIISLTEKKLTELEFDISSKIIITESLLAIYKVREIIQEIDTLN